MIRRILDRLYTASGMIAAVFIAGIAALVFAQVCFNLADKVYSAVAGRGLGLTIPSYSDITGFFLAAASFLALAYTLRSGGHIRVSLLTSIFPKRGQRLAEAVAIGLGAAMAGYATWFMALLIAESIQFNDKTSGMVSIPLWVPQLPVALGLGILTIALVDELVCVMAGSPPSYDGKGESLLSE